MTDAMKNGLNKLLPAPVRSWWRMRFGWRWFRGDYHSWSEARAASSGYDDAMILQRVAGAMRLARAVPGGWERDGTVFQHSEPNAPLLRALAVAAAENGGSLEVVDFGGALGSTWWQHRKELSSLGLRSWVVVEQPQFIEAGKEFANETLAFAPTMAAALELVTPQVVLFSGVLTYLESPAGVLGEAVGLGFAHVMLDRTPMISSGPARLAVQHTPAELGGGSYPVWLWTEDALLAPLRPSYEKVESWPALDRLATDVHHRGFHFRRRKP